MKKLLLALLAVSLVFSLAASVLTRFYKPEELIEKSDAELQKIQNGLEPMKVK